MKVGITTNKQNSKIHGPVINYSTNKGTIKVKLMVDFERKFLRAFTASNLKGDIYHDLSGTEMLPAVQNMTMKSGSSTLRVKFDFDQPPFEMDKEKDQLLEL